MPGALPDRRLHPRRPFVLRVDFAGGRPGGDTTENLSRSGLFVQTDRPFDIGERIPLSLSFPGLLDPIEIVGQVVWIRTSRADERAETVVSLCGWPHVTQGNTDFGMPSSMRLAVSSGGTGSEENQASLRTSCVPCSRS